jgi:broad specificity phosphatase PhoE
MHQTPVRAALLTAALFIAGLLTTGCTEASPAVVYVVRHAEKATTPAGDPTLTAAGEARAQSLADKLGDKAIVGIYSTDTTRTQSTAAPLAAKVGLPVVSYSVTEDLVARVRTTPQDKVVVIVGHSNTVPLILTEFGAETPAEIAAGIPHEEYDNLYMLQLSGPKPALTALKF